MDKYEYKLRSEEIAKLIEEEKYAEAANIADTIDWRRVKSITMLLKVGALYRVNRRNEDSKAVLQLAYDRYPTNRSVVYSLCEVSIELDDVVAAIEYYKEFVKLAPRDNGVFTLRYRILEAQEASLEERIELLEELKKRDYQEEWAYELAYLYHRVGLATKCVEECDDLILWFGDGPYVMKAMELKMLHAPLTPIQQKKYDMAKQQTTGYSEDDTYAQDDYPQDTYVDEEYFQENYVQEDYPQDEYPQGDYVQEDYPQDDYAQGDYPQEDYLQDAYDPNDEAEADYANTSVSSAYHDTGSIDMSQYNTINLQKVVAESMKELFPDDEDIFAEEKAGLIQPVAVDEEEADIADTDEEAADIAEPETSEEAEPEEPIHTHTGRIAQMVTGVSEMAPEPHTGRISKVFVPGVDARQIRQDTDMDMLRDTTEETVQEEHERMEENGSNVFEEQPSLQEEAAAYTPEPQEAVAQEDEQSEIFHPMTGQMNLDEVLLEWECIKQQNAQKHQEEVRRLVKQQTGKMFESFDEAVRNDVLEELEAPKDIQAEQPFAEEDAGEVEELAEIEDTQEAEAEYAEEDEAVGQEEYAEDEDMQETSAQQLLETQEIDMNTAEISSLPDKIIEATDKETQGVKKEEIREFTPEEQELFENFAVTRKIRKQIIYALDKMSLASYTGNVLITGEAGLGTVRMAKNLIREYQAMDANFSGKVAKITGEKLNMRDLGEVFAKLENGAIIIEKANGLTQDKLYEMANLLNQDNLGIIVIMEDTRKEITHLLEKQAFISDYFNIRIDLMEMDNNALVAYAKNYALALEYSIDELGTLALYTRIANSQSGNHVVTKDEVRDIIDEAIWKSRKFNIKNFVDVLFAKRYDRDDMIVLRERDFM